MRIGGSRRTPPGRPSTAIKERNSDDENVSEIPLVRQSAASSSSRHVRASSISSVTSPASVTHRRPSPGMNTIANLNPFASENSTAYQALSDGITRTANVDVPLDDIRVGRNPDGSRTIPIRPCGKLVIFCIELLRKRSRTVSEKLSVQSTVQCAILLSYLSLRTSKIFVIWFFHVVPSLSIFSTCIFFWLHYHNSFLR